LRSWPIFAHANLESLAFIADRLEQLSYKAGEAIWLRGDPSPRNLILVNGRVRVTTEVSNDDGSTDKSWFVGEGFTCGAFDSVARVPRWYDAHAETDVRALSLRNQTILDVLEDDLELARDMLAQMATMLIEARIRSDMSVS